MLNFNDGEERLNKFSGSEKKTTILHDGTLYMLKAAGSFSGSDKAHYAKD